MQWGVQPRLKKERNTVKLTTLQKETAQIQQTY